jgi:signal transduction histidine kinase
MRLLGRYQFPRRQALLFLVAILLPCAVLVVLGLQVIEQERQLEQKRFTEERQRTLQDFRPKLLSQLENIKLQLVTQTAARHAEARAFRPQGVVAFAGPLQDGRLLLPWENSSKARQFREGLYAGKFADKIREAESEELAANRFENAARLYRAAIDSATEPAQRTYAHLLLARTLQKLGRRIESLKEYEQVLAAPPDAVDELDIPFGLYAAPALLQAGLNRSEVSKWIELAKEKDRLLPPTALRMARDLATNLSDSQSVSELEGLIRDREQAEGLQHDAARVIPLSQAHEPVWALYGNPQWFVSLTPPLGDFDGLLIAVRANEVLQQSSPSRVVRLPSAAEADGQPLGDGFSRVRVIMPESGGQQNNARQSFLVVALVLALTFTILAGCLLWRDVRRDLRLSEMRSQFVSSVTHELKTPLTAIRMFTETLRLDEEVDRQTRVDYLDTILHESERLSRLVDNVLDFGKIEHGRKTYRFQPVRLDEVVEQAARSAQYPLEQAGFVLDVAAEQGLPPISADSDALQQAILNLLTNAMKYSGESRSIGLRLERRNAHARIQDVDHGIGIAADEYSRIFDRFYRASVAENHQIPGTGLGLTIVAHIVNAHGGAVEVASELGRGSSFTISLPLEAGA